MCLTFYQRYICRRLLTFHLSDESQVMIKLAKTKLKSIFDVDLKFDMYKIWIIKLTACAEKQC